MVLEVGRQHLDQTRAQTLERIPARTRRSHVVDLVHHQDVELPGIARMDRQDLAQETKPFTGLHPVHRGDQAREGGPGIGVYPAFPTQVLYVVRVHDLELEPELLEHLHPPLLLEGGRTDDEHGTRAMTQQQFLDHQPGFDGLAQADVVGDEEIGTCHVDGADQGVQLEFLDTDTTTKRRLQKPSIRIGGRPPPDSVQERLQRQGIVVPRRTWHARPFDDPRAGFDLPDDFERLTEAIFVDGREGDVVLGRRAEIGQGSRVDVDHDPLPSAYLDELARFGHRTVKACRLRIHTLHPGRPTASS